MIDQENGLVSVIVPAYNAETVLDQCLKSIYFQTYKSLEVIIVNDGSNDATKDIAERWSQKDQRFRVINKKNGGVSSARNDALEQSHGEWLTFVDSDDYLEPNFIEKLLSGDIGDLIVGGYHTVGAQEIPEVLYSDIVADNQESMAAILEHHLTDMSFLCPWGKIFRNSIIKDLGLTFRTDMRIGEDVVFVWTYIINCSSIALKSNQGYNYYTEDSDFKYALDEKTSLMTIHRILTILESLEKRVESKMEKARSHILNYYIWLYKLYIKKNYHYNDIQRMTSFFYQKTIFDYYQNYKWKSKDKTIVYLLLKMHLISLLYIIIKIYY